MNVSDSERIAGFLEARSFKQAKDIAKADLVIFNTCGVRQSAENRVFGLVHNIRKKEESIKDKANRKIIILTGCLANRKDVQRKLKDKVDLFCEIKDFPNKIKFILTKQVRASTPEPRVSGKTASYLKSIAKNKVSPETQGSIETIEPAHDNNYLCVAPKYTSPTQAFVPVMTGCNNFCAYCVVPYARGREVSRPTEDIISEIDALVKSSYKEITLLGQNVNSYKCDKRSVQVSDLNRKGSNEVLKNNAVQVWRLEPTRKNSEIENLKLIENCKLKIVNSNTLNFPKLLDFLCESYPAIRFKFLTSHPKDFSDELIDVIAKNKNIDREIHLPVQAGSNRILKAMNRPYTQKHYLNLIKKAREKIPGAAFTTDVIVGFPGETEKDFLETVKVFEKVKYNEAYINKYSPRPGTAAWKLGDPVSWDEKKRREKILRQLVSGQSAPEHEHRSGLSAPATPNKIIAILGPTSSGKSDIAIKLARKFNGEIISADSRQIYRGLDIGTGKVPSDSFSPVLGGDVATYSSGQRGQKGNNVFFSEGIPHYMINIVSPRTNFSAAQFKKRADKIIADILQRGKLPIICGGTGFWIKAVVDNVIYPEVKPNWVLRNMLRNKSAKELYNQLKRLDPTRAKTIDKNNPVRLIRAIEICKTLGSVPSPQPLPTGQAGSPDYGRGGKSYPSPPYSGEMSRRNRRDREGTEYAFLQIGIKLPKEKLHQNIKTRLKKRFQTGMIQEVKKLHFKDRISWKRLGSFGLGYNLIPKYLKGEIKTEEELFEKIYQAEKDYAKRQMTWFQKDKRIVWLEKYRNIEKEVSAFLLCSTPL